ncbi:hypothetical protein [Aquimarina sp. AU474]|uniref:hypothetical protein n=1 Tax=Aquimarina sp. AU474 TaxID=2108529 RepID=UPI001358E00C|nr:hypothetical protein [Aquimarina sp. AU474]
MKNTKLNLNKIVIMKLDNLHTIKGGKPTCDTNDSKSCTAKQTEDGGFTEEGTLDC